MPQYVQLPNGQYFPLKEGENPYAAIAEAQQLYPNIFNLTKKEVPKEQPQSGFTPAFKASASQLKADMANLAGKTGFITPERAEEINKEEKEYQNKTFKPTDKGWLEAFGTKFGELAGGSAPYMIAPAALGLGAMVLPEAAAAAPVVAGGSALLDALGLGTVGQATAAGGAGLASLAQFTGSNLSRQVDTGKSLADTSLGSAALAAVPQAALDVFGLKMIPGIRNIFGEAGHKISDAEARAIASQGLRKTLGDYVATTGKVAGAEGLTEAGQQVFERLQAGLSLTDPDAQKEYFDNFLGGAVLGGVLGVPGRFVERGQAKSQAAAADRADKATQLAQQQALDAQQKQDQKAFKQTDEYITDLTQRWNAFDTQYKDLLAKESAKVAKDDLVGKADRDEARRAKQDLLKDPDNQDLINEYRAVKSKVDAQRAEDARQKAAEEKKAAYDKAMQQPGAQGELFGGTADQDLIEADRKQQPAATENIPTAKEFNTQHANIARGLYLAKQNAAEAENEDVAAQHINEHAILTEQQKKLETLRPLVQQAEPNERLINPADLNFEDNDAELKKQRKKLEDARQLGDMEAAKKASDKVQELKQRPTLFGEENVRPSDEELLAQQMSDAQQTAITERKKIHPEITQKITKFAPNKGAMYGVTSVNYETQPGEEVASLQKIAEANAQPGIFTNAVEQRKADIAKKELEDAKALLAKFKQQPYETTTGEIIKPPDLTQDWQGLKEKPEYAQENIEGEPTNYELLDKRVEKLLDQLLPKALGEKPIPTGKPNVERRVQSDGGIQTFATRDNGTVAQNVTHYTYSVKNENKEAQQVRVERDNTTGETEARLLEAGRPIGDPLGIKDLVAGGSSHIEALKQVLPEAKNVNRIKTQEEPADLLAQNQPNVLVGGESVTPNKTVESRRKTLEKIRDFIYRIKDLKKRIPAMHAEMMRGVNHPEYPELIKEYQYLQGRLEELQNVSERAQGPGRHLPIVEAQDLLEDVDTNKKILADLNESVQKAGKPSDPVKVKELEMLRERRAFVKQQIEDATDKYNKLAQREQKAKPAGEQEQGDLFGLAGEYAKSGKTVQKIKDTLDRLYKERDELKASFNRRTEEATTPLLKALLLKYSKEPVGRYEETAKEIEYAEQELMNATGKTSAKFQAFADEREAQKTPVEQTAQQKLLPGFELKQYNEIKKPVPAADLMAAKTKQVSLQTQLENLRKAAGNISNPAIETKLHAQIEKARANVVDLERKQRAYEDQQDAINKAPPGQRAAKRLIAGEGYTTYKGQARTNPKNPESWGLTGAEKAITEKPSALVKVAAKKREAKKLVEIATKEREEAGANETVASARARLLQLESAVNMLTEQLQHANKVSLKDLKRRFEIAQADFDIAQTMALKTPPQETAKVTKEIKDTEDALAKLTAKPVLGPPEDLARYKHEVSLLTTHLRNLRRELPLEDAKEKLKDAKEAYDAMSKSIAYSPFEKNAETRKEISVLQAFIKKHSTKKVINNAKNILARFKEPIEPAEVGRLAIQMQNNLANTKILIEPFIKRLDDLRLEYEALTKPGAFQAETDAMGPGILQNRIDRVLEEAKEIDKLHTAAVVRYAMARRDLLAFQYASSLGLQEEYKKTVEARDKERARQEKNPKLQENLAQIQTAIKTQAKAETLLNAAIEKEKTETGKFNAKQRAEEEEEVQALKDVQTISGGVASDVFQRAREGLGLEGTRVELDTSGPLATAVQNNAKKMLGMAQTQLIAVEENEKKIKERIKEAEENLEKASTEGKAKDVAKYKQQIKDLKKELNAAGIPRNDLTLAIKRYEKALAQVLPAAEIKKTELNKEEEEDTTAEAFDIVPGQRLRARREGPVVSKAARAPNTMLSGTAESRVSEGRRNPPKQAGVVRLRASDLDHNTANAVSLATLDKKRKAATGEEKAKYQEAFDGATKNMTPAQIKERLKEGNRLLESGPTLAVIAAKERFRAATETYKKALKALTDAEDSATATFPNTASIKIAEAEVEAADTAREKAEEAMHKAVADHGKTKQEASSAREADAAVEEDVEFTDKASKHNRLQQAIDDRDEDFFAAAAREAPGTPLPDEAVGPLLDGSLIRALEKITKHTTGFLADHAEAVRPFLMRTKVVILPEIIFKGKSVPALYDAGTNTVYFTPQGFTNEDVVHEATHAATMYILTLPKEKLNPTQLAARNELERMYAKLKSNPKFADQYGLENIKEFVSEIMSNETLRNDMNGRPWYKGNMLVRAIKAIIDLFRKTPLSENMLTVAEDSIKSIFTQSRVIKGGEKVGASPKYKSALVGSSPDKWDTFRGNFLGLPGRVQIFDKLAAVDEALVAAEGADKLTSTEAFNTQYFMRLGDQVSTAAGEFILHGPMAIVSEDTPLGKEYRYQSQKGVTLLDVSDHLGNLAKELDVHFNEAERMATVLIAGERASSISNGWTRLSADNPAGVKAEYDADIATINSNPKAKAYFLAVKNAYKAYNDGQLDFAVDTDFMSKAEAERLKRLPYIPYYRIKDGVVQLFTADERPITIGNIKDSPDLQQMVGDSKHILPLLTSAVQNTFMLSRMSLHNKATLETANGLFKAGFVSKMGAGAGLANVNTVHYKIKGKDAFATIDADTFGIPAHLIVAGMEGIKTTIPAVVKLMGIPAYWIRKFVTRMPAYGVRQLLRDPVNSFILSGVDGVPMVNALKELSKMNFGKSQAEEDLMRGLAVSSNIFSGDERDMTKFLQDIATGKSPWQTFMGKLDRFALQTDTATKAVIYEDGLKKGLSKARAQFRAFESQNLSRRGLSPSMQVLNTLIPFFNSQIQGLDILYRSLTNKMPFAEQMEIRRKIVARGMLLMGVSLGYALMMQDDEDYRKASPEERYGNFFVHIPFVKDPLKIPIPYEVGILFKAVPEMLVDSMHKEMTTYEAARGMGKLIWQNAVPGLSFAGTKPITEAVYGQTELGPIETQHEKTLMATERYRPNTTELAKVAGKATGMMGISPIMLEHFVRGYTGSLGLAAMHMVDPIFASGQEGEKPSLPASKTPFIGSLFQTSEGRYLKERAYERMNDVQQAQNTYKDMLKKGQRANAEAFRERYADLIAAGSAAGAFKKNMGDMFSMARVIASNPNLTQEEKDKQLETITNRENAMARHFTEMVDRRARQ